ncbi:MAG: MBL fold metallo-hydrolase [Armatimonadetes bacterium]|nr:MBL fold metallo-hydrolase [Armatimonadota bacterium]
MIEPTVCSAALVEQVLATNVSDERVAVWWLGHGGYLLKYGQTVVAVDPYLSDCLAGKQLGARQTAAVVSPAELTCLNLVLVTQRGADHCDPEAVPALLKASPEALLVLPSGLGDMAADELGIADERFVPIRAGEFFEQGGITVHALGDTTVDEPKRLQYVLTTEAGSIYLPGDVQPLPGQAEAVAPYAPALAFMPISGRGAALQALGLPGSMTPIEAARLADEIGVQVVVPQHYDMFELHRADPAAFREFAKEHFPKLKVRILEPGARWIYPPEG